MLTASAGLVKSMPRQDAGDRTRGRSRSRTPTRNRDTYSERDTNKYVPRTRSRSPVGSSNRRRSRSRSHSPKRRRRSNSRDEYRRSRSRSRERDRTRGERDKRSKRRSRSRSVSSVSSTSSSHRHRKRKKKHRERSSRSRERKERKKEKKERKKKGSAATSHSQWGKYGIISETDIYNKAAEFHTWLVEERKINPETISKDHSKKEFAKFVEDFNTATLPHEKYYDITSYDNRMAALRSGTYLPPPTDTYDPQEDLKAHSIRHKKPIKEHESYLSKEQLMELRKVQHERIEAGKMKLLGMDVKQNMGVRMDGTVFDD